jgi:hypothetical protein
MDKEKVIEMLLGEIELFNPLLYLE